ncbi:hypothetical protein [Gluconobacter oxydans]|uniref:hypothetical protein n=1 Tax=Gluconobacter oxydans TaxID=442 RepID=UPI001CD8F671|nr:hypothetical protein [Gluconobacter oxydans]
MATAIQMKNESTGIIKNGYYGFSWTTFFFGSFPALFRQDFKTFFGTFAVYVLLGLMTFGIGGFIAGIAWAFMYNKYYTRKLIEQGYKFVGSQDSINAACAAVGVSNV